MSDSTQILESLIDALPEEADARAELVALGSAASLIIGTMPEEARADLVECFCDTLRKGVQAGLN